MNNQPIIKWRFIWAYIWAIGILYVIVYVAEDQVFSTHYSAWFFGLFQILFGIYYYFKTRVWHYLVVGIVLGMGYWHYEAAVHMDTFFSPLTFYIHLVIIFIVLFTLGPGLNKALRLEVHARKMFRLAAETVVGTENGFTSRPYSAGKTEYSRNELIGLARFLAGQDIIRYHIGDDNILFSFSMNISPQVDTGFKRTSTIVFDMEGNMSVKISKADYNQYSKKFSFDQLCESFGHLFRHFIEAYQSNNDKRIIDELRAA
jgi:hypothetical protein